MPKISWGDARQILENIVRDWKDSKGLLTKTAQLSSEWLHRTKKDKKGKHKDVVGVETDSMFYTSPYEDYVVGFIDDAPDKRWPHSCRYVFVSITGERHVLSASLPPKSMTKYKFEQVIPPPDYKQVIVIKANEEEKW